MALGHQLWHTAKERLAYKLVDRYIIDNHTCLVNSNNPLCCSEHYRSSIKEQHKSELAGMYVDNVFWLKNGSPPSGSALPLPFGSSVTPPTACYGQCRPKKLTPWEILCFQPLWDMGGPYCSSGNFFYLAVFEISELVANIGWKLKHLVPRDSFFIVMDLKNGAYSKTAK